MTYLHRILALVCALIIALTLTAGGASAEEYEERPITEEDTTLYEERLEPAECIERNRSETKDVAHENTGYAWHFTILVHWWDCPTSPNAHPIKKVVARYFVSGDNRRKKCQLDDIVKAIHLNPGEIAGWNVPVAKFPCSATVHSGQMTWNAPVGTAVRASNDNKIGMVAKLVRVWPYGDPTYDVPVVVVPRP